MDVFLCGFVKENVHVPLLPKTLYDLKTPIRKTGAKTDHQIIHNVRQEDEYRFDVA
jgi:hypothetical protein